MQVVVFDGVQRLSVLGEYKNELEALVANELMSPAQPLSQLSDKEMQVGCSVLSVPLTVNAFVTAFDVVFNIR